LFSLTDFIKNKYLIFTIESGIIIGQKFSYDILDCDKIITGKDTEEKWIINEILKQLHKNIDCCEP